MPYVCRRVIKTLYIETLRNEDAIFVKFIYQLKSKLIDMVTALKHQILCILYILILVLFYTGFAEYSRSVSYLVMFFVFPQFAKVAS